MNEQRSEYNRVRYLTDQARRQEAQRNYYHANKAAVRKANSRWREANRQLEAVMRVIGRAKKNGTEYDRNYLASLQCPDTCPILGVRISFNCTKDNCEAASFDRIDNIRGYVPGNVQIISKRANTIKNDASPAELIAFAKWAIHTFSDI